MILGYARCSTVAQELDIQKAALEAAGAERIYFEKASGAKRDRPELNKMLEQLRPGDICTVCHLDRLARSLSDLLWISERIEKAGAQLRIMGSPLDTTTEHGQLMFQLLGAFAQFEKSMIVRRTSEGRKAAQARGVKFGPRPTFTPEVLNAAAELAQQEGMSVTRAARQFRMSRATLYSHLKNQADNARAAS